MTSISTLVTEQNYGQTCWKVDLLNVDHLQKLTSARNILLLVGLVTKLCPTLETPWTVDHQAPLSMGFSRQEYWSGLPFPFSKYTPKKPQVTINSLIWFFPTPQFKSINSSALGFPYSPTPHPYTTKGKTIALTIQTFVGKVMSLLFNMLSRLVIAFLPRSKR